MESLQTEVHLYLMMHMDNCFASKFAIAFNTPMTGSFAEQTARVALWVHNQTKPEAPIDFEAINKLQTNNDFLNWMRNNCLQHILENGDG